MTPEPTPERLKQQILEFLEETFEKHHGIYLDKGTTFFETLDAVSADEASLRATDRNASVAAHVRHVIFYLRVLQDHIRGTLQGKVDWREIWENDRPVSPDEWKALVAELRQEYAKIRAFLGDPKTWDLEEAFGGSMAMVVHTAYHLGAVRQSLALTRARLAERAS
jgi:DinB family protein